MTLLTALAIVVPSVLAGCLDQGAVGQTACDTPLDREGWEEKWGALADRTYRDFDVVNFRVQAWDARLHPTWTPENPPPFADWSEWSPDLRPQMLADALCLAHGRAMASGKQDLNMGGGSAPDRTAHAAMLSIHEEIERQAGVWLEPFHDSCCVVRFLDTFYAVGIRYFYVTMGEGGVGDRTFYDFEGQTGIEATVLGERVEHETAEPFPFYVKPSAKIIHVEAKWSDPDFALDLLVRTPGAGPDDWTHTVAGGAFQEPRSRVSMTIWRNETEDWNGDWNVTMRSPDLAVHVEYEIVITLFNHEPVFPRGYSAFQ